MKKSMLLITWGLILGLGGQLFGDILPLNVLDKNVGDRIVLSKTLIMTTNIVDFGVTWSGDAPGIIGVFNVVDTETGIYAGFIGNNVSWGYATGLVKGMIGHVGIPVVNSLTFSPSIMLTAPLMARGQGSDRVIGNPSMMEINLAFKYDFDQLGNVGFAYTYYTGQDTLFNTALGTDAFKDAVISGKVKFDYTVSQTGTKITYTKPLSEYWLTAISVDQPLLTFRDGLLAIHVSKGFPNSDDESKQILFGADDVERIWVDFSVLF